MKYSTQLIKGRKQKSEWVVYIFQIKYFFALKYWLNGEGEVDDDDDGCIKRYKYTYIF